MESVVSFKEGRIPDSGLGPVSVGFSGRVDRMEADEMWSVIRLSRALDPVMCTPTPRGKNFAEGVGEWEGVEGLSR